MKENFIKKVNDKFGYIFTFEKTEYKNNYSPVIITCIKHGDLEVIPYQLLRSKIPCEKCRIESRQKIESEKLLLKAAILHKNKYDYSLVKYNNTISKVEIICPIHGIFEMTMGNHVYNGYGCPQCYYDTITTYDKFIEKAKKNHNNKYKYADSFDEYYNIEIYCDEHNHHFTQRIHNHLLGQGCPICGLRKKEKMIAYLSKMNLEFSNNKNEFEIPKLNLKLILDESKEGFITVNNCSYRNLEKIIII